MPQNVVENLEQAWVKKPRKPQFYIIFFLIQTLFICLALLIMDADWWYSYFSCVYFKVYLPLTVCTGYYVHIQWTHIWSPLQPTAMWCTPSAPSTALQAAGGERTDPSHMLEHRKPHLTERVAHTPGWDPGLSSGAKLDTSFGIWTDLTELLDSSLALNPSGGLRGAAKSSQQCYWQSWIHCGLASLGNAKFPNENAWQRSEDI